MCLAVGLCRTDRPHCHALRRCIYATVPALAECWANVTATDFADDS